MADHVNFMSVAFHQVHAKIHFDDRNCHCGDLKALGAKTGLNN